MSVNVLDGVAPPSPASRSPEFEADLVRLREAVVRWQNSFTSPPAWMEVRLLPRLLGFRFSQVHTATQALLLALVAMAVRLLAPLLVTTVTWSWTGAPIWTWLAAAVIMAALDLFGTRVHGETSLTAEKMFALPAVIDKEADLHELVEFTRRWWRTRTCAPAALALTVAVLVTSAAATPDAFRTFHLGSLAMLALLVHEFIEGQLMVFVAFRVFVKESHSLHRLSWLDPLSSPPVQAMLHTWFVGIGAGSPMLVAHGLAVGTLIGPVAPELLLVPLAALSLIGFILIVVSVVTLRRSVRRIVQLAKDASLERLRERIESLEPRERALTLTESEQLRALLATYAAVRDAPTGPSGAQTVGHAISALAVPALTFLFAVMSEVYAERLLDQFLP